jgi:hypothetical protein
MIVPASFRGPSDRWTLGRAVCREGALAVVTCSVGVARSGTDGELCQKVLASLTIERVGAVERIARPEPAMDRVPEAKPEAPSAPPAPPSAPAAEQGK